MLGRTQAIIAILVGGIAVATLVSGAYARQDSDETLECISNLKQVGLVYCMYMQDYDEMLPPTKNPAHLVKVLYPYCKNKNIFTCPASHNDYKPNATIGTLPLAAFAAPASMPIYYDVKPHADGKYGVAYLDGRARAVNQAVVLPPAPIVKPRVKHKHRA